MKLKIILLVVLSAMGGFVDRNTATVPAQVQASPAVKPGAEYSAPASIEWLSEAEAKASGKPIFYYVTMSKGCAWCKVTEKMFADPTVILLLSDFSCVKVIDAAPSHPWMRFHGVDAFPSQVFATTTGEHHCTFEGAPTYGNGTPHVSALLSRISDGKLWLKNRTKKRITDNPPQKDQNKVSIAYPSKPTLAPASHNTVAPTHPKGRLVAGTQERSCVTCRVRGGRCVQPTPGIPRQLSFSPSRRGRR